MGFSGFGLYFLLCSSFLATTSGSFSESFIQCLWSNSKSTPHSVTSTLYSSNNSSYSSILEFSIQNLMFISSVPKPQFIITPLHQSHIQAAVICSKLHRLLIRVRSGGHDYEGMSYRSDKPFIIIDLVKFQEIIVDVKNESAWVQAGATVGQVYYRIAEKSSSYGFPAGICPTTGVGGYISGGGIGLLMRKYGLAADNVVDAHFIDVNGRIHDRKSMGEDTFWAIRGGGGASFGVILSWKIRLVPVPSVVTVFNAWRTLEEGATSIFYKWQNIAHKFHKDLTVRTVVQRLDQGSNRTIQIQFQSLFLGGIEELLSIMEIDFPELGLEAKDCNEMSWLNSTLKVAMLDGHSPEVLLNRSQQSKSYFKGKSDFVKKPISMAELQSIWKVMLEDDISPLLICEPMGGIMDEISEYAVPFPHRVGNLYNVQYFIEWKEKDGGLGVSSKYLEATRRLYNYMTPYVSKSPRASYLNYKDLDLGVNQDVDTSCSEASVWGRNYFKSNFGRLVYVKGKVDPENYFWNEQSIPPLVSGIRKGKAPFVCTPLKKTFVE